MAQILLFSQSEEEDVLPALSLLAHKVKRLEATTTQVVNVPNADVIVMDATGDLASARSLCRILSSAGNRTPVMLAINEGSLAVINPEWMIDDVILDSASPAEVDARIRMLLGRNQKSPETNKISASGVTIDEANYSAKVNGRPLDLTYKEFELLKFLATNPSRVFTREQLLSEVWGYDYFGGTRTVDVHVRRLRAKLGDLDSLIGTVRNVGYRFNLVEETTI